MSKLGSWLKGEITPEEKEILLELKNNLTFFPKKRISDDDGFNLELRDGKVVGLKLSGFKAIPRAIYKLKNLEWIELVENNRIYPPLEEDLLPNLIDLKISSNPIKKLSVTFGNFRSLEVLDLSNNKLETLPDIFHQLKNLKKVILRNNQLNDLPESFEQLHQLNELDLSYNRFHVSLPSSLRKLNKLEHVKIDNNFFGDVPLDKVLYTLFLGCDWWLEKHPPNKPYSEFLFEYGQDFQSGLVEIEINQEYRIIKRVFIGPKEADVLRDIFNARYKMKYPSKHEIIDRSDRPMLSVKDNHIQKLRILPPTGYDHDQLKNFVFPESICTLSKLEHLNISNLKIKSLPESIGNLTELNALILHGNELTTLPASIGNLVNLETLIVSDNHLTELPKALDHLKKLKTLKFENNRSISIPPLKIQIYSSVLTLDLLTKDVFNEPRQFEDSNIKALFRESLKKNISRFNSIVDDINKFQEKCLSDLEGMVKELHECGDLLLKWCEGIIEEFRSREEFETEAIDILQNNIPKNHSAFIIQSQRPREEKPNYAMFINVKNNWVLKGSRTWKSFSGIGEVLVWDIPKTILKNESSYFGDEMIATRMYGSEIWVIYKPESF